MRTPKNLSDSFLHRTNGPLLFPKEKTASVQVKHDWKFSFIISGTVNIHEMTGLSISHIVNVTNEFHIFRKQIFRFMFFQKIIKKFFFFAVCCAIILLNMISPPAMKQSTINTNEFSSPQVCHLHTAILQKKRFLLKVANQEIPDPLPCRKIRHHGFVNPAKFSHHIQSVLLYIHRP